MKGDDRSRYCTDCKLNVYNLSGMTREEAEAFLRKSEGRLCVRYYRRADGKIMTRDCPQGLAEARRRFAMTLTTIFALWMMACAYAMAGAIPKEQFDELKSRARNQEPFRSILDAIEPHHETVGKIAISVAPSSPTGP